MKVKDYEYSYPNEGYEISEERKEKIIESVKDKIRKGFIPLHCILDIVKDNDNEFDFVMNWLDGENIIIRGNNSSLAGIRDNYKFIAQLEQGYEKAPKERLSKEEQREYFVKIRQGDEKAKKEFIEKNVRLARWVANSSAVRRLARTDEARMGVRYREEPKVTAYKQQDRPYEDSHVKNPIGITQEDKVQMAMIGLIKAVDSFDYSLGYTFSSCAVPKIYWTIVKECYKEQPGPFYLAEELEKYKDEEEMYFSRTGKMPTEEDMAHMLGVKINEIKKLKKIQAFYSTESIEKLEDEKQDEERILSSIDDTARGVNFRNGTIIDDKYVSDGEYIVDGVYLDEIEEDENHKIISTDDNTPIDTALEAEIGFNKDYLNEALKSLTEIERKVLELRFGFTGEYPRTLESISKEFNVSRGRIKQIEAKALRILRHPSRSRKLNGILYSDGGYDYRLYDGQDIVGGLDETLIEKYKPQDKEKAEEEEQKIKEKKEIIEIRKLLQELDSFNKEISEINQKIKDEKEKREKIRKKTKREHEM